MSFPYTLHNIRYTYRKVVSRPPVPRNVRSLHLVYPCVEYQTYFYIESHCDMIINISLTNILHEMACCLGILSPQRSYLRIFC